MMRSLNLIFLTLMSLMFCSNAFTVLPPQTNHQKTNTVSSSPQQQRHVAASTFCLNMADAGPATLDRPEVIEKKDTKDDVDEEQKNGTESWEVRLYNDPMNKREFVARCLTQITGLSDSAAYQVMMQAHNFGLATVGRYAFEMAELYHEQLREQGLSVDMVPVDDE